MMKKEIKIAIAVVLLIWSFVMGFELGIYKERKANIQAGNEVVNTVNPTTQPTAPTTAAPTTVAPTTEAPTTQPTTVLPPVIDPNQNSTAPTVAPSTDAPVNSADPSSLSKAQIVEKMNGYMKELKAEQNVKAHKSENITVEVTDCSVQAAVSLINNLIKNLAGSEELDYTISNGASTAGETMYAIIPPTNKDFLISEAAVLTAEAKTSGTDTVYTVVLVEESTTVTSPVPQYNSTAIGYLDLASLDLPGVTIAEADMKYPGSTVEIAVNADGKVTKLVNKMPMSGYGQAQISFFNGNATFQGALDETWTFTY
ncbi:MAG: hypothetical protein IJO73_07910 [Clostridia bacterium]|nr:hypothetical protein [Clostridia bacterium]